MRNKKGFTLIELIVVIVIIGILAAIAVPRFMGAQDRARIGACESDMNSFRQALGLYEIDHSDFPAGAGINEAALAALLVDLDGAPYMTLPAGNNWQAGSFAYTWQAGPPTSYSFVATANDNNNTVRTATPDGIQ